MPSFVPPYRLFIEAAIPCEGRAARHQARVRPSFSAATSAASAILGRLLSGSGVRLVLRAADGCQQRQSCGWNDREAHQLRPDALAKLNAAYIRMQSECKVRDRKERPTMIRAFLMIAAALAIVPAFAQVPVYDTARRCAEVAKGSHTVKNECRRDEADARRELEGSRIPQEVWATCREQVRAEQSYLLLYGCVLTETEANSNQRPTAQLPVAPVNAPATNAPATNTGARSRAAALVDPLGSITIIRNSGTTTEKP